MKEYLKNKLIKEGHKENGIIYNILLNNCDKLFNSKEYKKEINKFIKDIKEFGFFEAVRKKNNYVFIE